MKPGGYVPTSVIGPVILKLVAKADTVYEGVSALADRAGVSPDTLAQIVSERRETCEFDVADRVLCAANAQHLWWTELNDLYYDVDLSHDRCAHPDCNVFFLPRRGGGRRKRYCSQACADSARMGNRRVKHWGGEKCRNGHERTPENTIHLKNGQIRCRVCNNATSNRGYHRKKAQAA